MPFGTYTPPVQSVMTYDLSTPEGMARYKKLNPAARVSADPAYFKSRTLEDAIHEGLVDPYGGNPMMMGLHRAGGL